MVQLLSNLVNRKQYCLERNVNEEAVASLFSLIVSRMESELHHCSTQAGVRAATKPRYLQ